MVALALVPVLLGVFLGGCASNPATGGTDFVLMSEAQELALGRKLNGQVLEQYGRYGDEALQAYVQAVGERLARNSDRPRLVYRFTVVDSAIVNAFALPGGYIYITRGLMAYLNSEAQLAGVLGHELGHVNARHSVRQYSQHALIGLLGAVAASAAGVPGGGDLIQVLGTVIERGYGRRMELEADRLGARYLARSGYPPGAMIEVIEVLKAQEEFEKRLAREEGREPHSYHGLFATHPDNDKRLQEVVRAGEKLEAPTAVRDEGRERFLWHLDGLVYGDSARQGIRRGDRFYHAELNFALQFPEGWVIENRDDRLVGRTRDGVAHIQMLVEDLNLRWAPREYLARHLKLKGLHRGRTFRVNGLDGYTALVPGGRVAVIFMQQRAYIFIATVMQRKGMLADYDDRFLKTILSFHRLRPEERRLAEPLRIEIHRVRPDDTIHRLARGSPIPDHTEARLRLLNGLYPEGEPRPGALIKIVE